MSSPEPKSAAKRIRAAFVPREALTEYLGLRLSRSQLGRLEALRAHLGETRPGVDIGICHLVRVLISEGLDREGF